MICKGCACMTCAAWESCRYYAACESVEMAKCEQVKNCYWYKAETKQTENTKGENENVQMV